MALRKTRNSLTGRKIRCLDSGRKLRGGCCGIPIEDYFNTDDCKCYGFEGQGVCYSISIDNGTTPDFMPDGTVKIEVTGHTFFQYEYVCISGTLYFDGVHRIESVSTDLIYIMSKDGMNNETFGVSASVAVAQPKEIEVTLADLLQIPECYEPESFFPRVFYNRLYDVAGALNGAHRLTQDASNNCRWTKTIDLGSVVDIAKKMQSTCPGGTLQSTLTTRYLTLNYTRLSEDPYACFTVATTGNDCSGYFWPNFSYTTFFQGPTASFSTHLNQCVEEATMSNIIDSPYPSFLAVRIVYGGTGVIKAITPDYNP